MKFKKMRLLAFLAVIFLLAGISQGASAQVTEKDELTIYTVAEPEPIAGHEGAFYYKLCEAFEGCGVNIAYPDGENLAEHLAIYARQQEIPGISCGAGDAEAETAALPPALYLAVCSSDGRLSACLIAVSETTSGERYETEHELAETRSLHVSAKWDAAIKGVPESVEVALLRDGVIIDTAVLCRENNWEYTWRDLASGHSYTAVETNVPKGYIAGYKLEKDSVLITNTENTVIVSGA